MHILMYKNTYEKLSDPIFLVAAPTGRCSGAKLESQIQLS
jgi:hypothetical protein